MTYQPTPAQQAVIDADDPVLLVLGGAGTGKTSTAATAVRACLERRSLEAANGLGTQRSRALFLSFSRAAVAQILDRTAGILGTCKDQVEITTYHAFAWSLIERFGSAVGLPKPVLATEAEVKLFQPAGAIRYKDMVPLALRLCRVPAIAAHLRSRWSLVVCDELQDTDDRVPAAHRHPRRRAAVTARRPEPGHLLQPARRGAPALADLLGQGVDGSVT